MSSSSPTPGEVSTAESAARTASTLSAVLVDPRTLIESSAATSEPGTSPDQTAIPPATVPTAWAPSPVKIPRPIK
ncbi:hypothetical protein V1514DRAFT_322913 [Lipomyces japonicus]|uniref:uncharacterized protein n=1 Tax=Lipomyces japonicus TaxID=56871 RepID=UPI0034CFA529